MLEFLPRVGPKPAGLDQLKQASVDGDIETPRAVFKASWIDKSADERPFLCSYNDCLRIARENGNLNIASYLLDHGLKIPVVPVVEAVKASQRGFVKLFLDHEYDINTPIDQATPSPLMYVLNRIVRFEANFFSHAFRDHDLVAWLLERGADPNAGCEFDLTPMSYAVKSAPLHTIKLLFKNGASAYRGQVLHHSVVRNGPDRPEVVQLVLQKIKEATDHKSKDIINHVMYQEHPL